MCEIENCFEQQIKTAEMVLVGIGSKWARAGRATDHHRFFAEMETNQDLVWINEFASSIYMRECLDQKLGEAIGALGQLLKGKNYFVVSLSTDSEIFADEIRTDRVVMPCGNHARLQCSDKCGANTCSMDQEFEEKLKSYIKGEIKAKDIERPVCSSCGKYLVINEIKNQPYTEGYLEQWETYTKWLQGTLNHQLCVIELDVGMDYPSVIRWPFEKISYFNRKSTFFRVNDKFYQLPEELKDKGNSIKMSAIDFLANLFV